MDNIELLGNTKLPSVIADPFKKVQITAVRVHYFKSSFSDKFYASGKVEFENGNTKGEQNFEGSSFDEVVLKIKAMIENL